MNANSVGKAFLRVAISRPTSEHTLEKGLTIALSVGRLSLHLAILKVTREYTLERSHIPAPNVGSGFHIQNRDMVSLQCVLSGEI